MTRIPVLFGGSARLALALALQGVVGRAIDPTPYFDSRRLKEAARPTLDDVPRVPGPIDGVDAATRERRYKRHRRL